LAVQGRELIVAERLSAEMRKSALAGLAGWKEVYEVFLKDQIFWDM